MSRPAVGERLRRLEEERPEQVEEAPVGRVQLQSRVDAYVRARALRAPPLGAGTIAGTRCRFASRCGTVRPRRGEVSSWTAASNLAKSPPRVLIA